MLRYKAGYKYVDGGIHAQVLDFPAAITCAADLTEARRLLGMALVDVAEAAGNLRSHGCRPLREGRGHSVWVNPASGRQSAIPRHQEIGDYTARAICRQLGIPGP